METGKRKDESQDDSMALSVSKRHKTDTDLVVAEMESNKAVIPSQAPARTSNLQAPIMLLTGHKAEVFSLKFSPNGKYVASGSFDKTILLWEVYDECKNFLMFRGHDNAVLDVAWVGDNSRVYSASADKSAAIWDVETGARVRKLIEHRSIVNTVNPTRKVSSVLLTGSDDGNVKIWDLRGKGSAYTFNTKLPVFSACFSANADTIFVAGIDHSIKVYDVRKGELEYTLDGHEDSVTGIKLSPDGNYLASNGMDHTVRVWDVRAFTNEDRMVKVFQGVVHNFEKNLLRVNWSADGSKLSAGSADRFVYIWDTASRRLLYKLPGHKGSVNEVDFHPREPIVGSASSDKTIYLGEIKP